MIVKQNETQRMSVIFWIFVAVLAILLIFIEPIMCFVRYWLFWSRKNPELPFAGFVWDSRAFSTQMSILLFDFGRTCYDFQDNRTEWLWDDSSSLCERRQSMAEPLSTRREFRRHKRNRHHQCRRNSSSSSRYRNISESKGCYLFISFFFFFFVFLFAYRLFCADALRPVECFPWSWFSNVAWRNLADATTPSNSNVSFDSLAIVFSVDERRGSNISAELCKHKRQRHRLRAAVRDDDAANRHASRFWRSTEYRLYGARMAHSDR